MYNGFENEELSNWDCIDRPKAHLARLYFATARGRRQADGGLELPCDPWYHPGILHEVLLHLQKDLKHNAEKPNTYKHAGYLTFWIRKLKPFRHYPIFGGTQTNEFLALQFGLATVSSQFPGIDDKINNNQRLWAEWLYDLRYRAVSGHSITRQFELLTL